MKRKWLAIGIILLFVGVAIAPSINQSVVTASQNDDLVEVTTQACGIKGFGDTTVKLTREQYQNLKQYLVDFRTRLDHTQTRDEAISLFNEAVVEINTYGLLPKGMNFEQAQQLVTEDFLKNMRIGGNFADWKPSDDFNVCCLLSSKVTIHDDPYSGCWPISPLFLITLGLTIIPLIIYEKTGLKIFEKLAETIFISGILLWSNSPFRVMNYIFINDCDIEMHTIGLNGYVKDNLDFSLLLGYKGLIFGNWLTGNETHFLGYTRRVTT